MRTLHSGTDGTAVPKCPQLQRSKQSAGRTGRKLVPGAFAIAPRSTLGRTESRCQCQGFGHRFGRALETGSRQVPRASPGNGNARNRRFRPQWAKPTPGAGLRKEEIHRVGTVRDFPSAATRYPKSQREIGCAGFAILSWRVCKGSCAKSAQASVPVLLRGDLARAFPRRKRNGAPTARLPGASAEAPLRTRRRCRTYSL